MPRKGRLQMEALMLVAETLMEPTIVRRINWSDADGGAQPSRFETGCSEPRFAQKRTSILGTAANVEERG